MRIDPFYQKEVYMKKKKITVFGVFLLAVLLSACGTDQKQFAEESEVNTEEAERESDESSVQADEDVLIWRIDSPLDAEESEITKEMISVWQEPLNRLLKEKGLFRFDRTDPSDRRGRRSCHNRRRIGTVKKIWKPDRRNHTSFCNTAGGFERI